MADFTITLTVVPATPDEGFLLAVDPPTQEVPVGTLAQFLVTVSSTGYDGWVDLTISGLPEGATADFGETTIMAGDSTTLEITTDGVLPGTFPMIVSALASAE